MNKKLISSTTAVALFVALSGQAFAGAQLSGTGSGILVNKGAGYRPAQADTVLNNGDRVMATGKSGATLTFDDGCRIPVTSGQVFTIAKTSPCKFKAQFGGDGDAGPYIIGGLGAGFVAFIIAQGLRGGNKFKSP